VRQRKHKPWPRSRNGDIRRLAVFSIAGFVGLTLPHPTVAEVIVAATAAAQYEYNSNLFDLQPGFTIPGAAYTKRSDWSKDYSASAQLNAVWGRQSVYFVAGVDDLRYQYYSFLDHTDYKFKGGWNWRILAALDGKIEISRTRSMVPFSETLQSRLALQTEQRESMAAGWLFAPDWRLDSDAYRRVLQEPLAGAPDLRLSEWFAETTLNFIGRAGLVAGVNATYLNGDFSGASSQNPSYHQDTAGIRAIYQPTGRSSFAGELGFTRRVSALQIDDVSGATGKLAYTNQVTPKTSITLNVARNINTYVTGTGADFDTLAGLAFKWQATYKVRVSAGYTYTYSYFPRQGELPGTNRNDHLQLTSVSIEFEPRRWIVLRPYINLQRRTSDFGGATFNSSEVGISFNVYWSCAPPGTPDALQVSGILPCRT
jgi:hypothetical protein